MPRHGAARLRISSSNVIRTFDDKIPREADLASIRSHSGPPKDPIQDRGGSFRHPDQKFQSLLSARYFRQHGSQGDACTTFPLLLFPAFVDQRQVSYIEKKPCMISEGDGRDTMRAFWFLNCERGDSLQNHICMTSGRATSHTKIIRQIYNLLPARRIMPFFYANHRWAIRLVACLNFAFPIPITISLAFSHAEDLIDGNGVGYTNISILRFSRSDT